MKSSHLLRIMSGLSLGLALLLGAGCPEDQAAECLDTICTAGESTCQGNSTAICDADGKGIRYNDCGAGQYCLNGACTGRKCVNLGGGSCENSSTVTVCDENGTLQSTVSCGASEVCAGGACVPNSCTDGDTRCGDPYSVLTCTGGAWVEEVCSGGQLCGDTAGVKACVAPTCSPNTGRCDGNVSYLCNNTGATETATTCASNEVCESGFCRLKVCGEDLTPGADAVAETTTDASVEIDTAEVKNEIPPLEPLRVLKFAFGNTPKVFDLNLRADYIATDKALKIQGGKGLEKIEITIAPIDPSTLGKFDDTDSSETTVQFCYFDGLNAGPVEPCAVGFSHASIGYTVDITSNNGKGSRVIGTFSATLKDIGENNYQITSGQFDVPHF